MQSIPNIFIIASEYHSNITHRLHSGAQNTWYHATQSDVPAQTIWVPGAVEIPLTTAWVAEEHRPDAMVCLGCVIRGETPHFEYVCEQVSHGIQRVSLETQSPIIFGVLTVNHLNQALQRIGGTAGHKGSEAMEAALKMIAIKRNIQGEL